MFNCLASDNIESIEDFEHNIRWDIIETSFKKPSR